MNEPLTVTVTGIACETPLLMALTVTAYVPMLVPAPADTIRVEVALPPWGNVTDLGLIEQDNDELHESATVPEKPSWLVMLSLVVDEAPVARLNVSSLVDNAKSGDGPEGAFTIIGIIWIAFVTGRYTVVASSHSA
jgi:hypothetical protein